MKLVRNLSVGVLLLIIISSCVPRYTCKQAPLHCASCRTIELTYKPVPSNILSREYPEDCRLVIDPFAYKLITKTEAPVSDMQMMVSEYRRITDYMVGLEKRKANCQRELVQQKIDITADSKKYCERFNMIYDAARAVCVPNPETEG